MCCTRSQSPGLVQACIHFKYYLKDVKNSSPMEAQTWRRRVGMGGWLRSTVGGGRPGRRAWNPAHNWGAAMTGSAGGRESQVRFADLLDSFAVSLSDLTEDYAMEAAARDHCTVRFSLKHYDVGF